MLVTLKKIVALATISLAFTLAACGEDGGSSGPDATAFNESDLVVATFEDLPVCGSKRDGATAYVKKKLGNLLL